MLVRQQDIDLGTASPDLRLWLQNSDQGEDRLSEASTICFQESDDYDDGVLDGTYILKFTFVKKLYLKFIFVKKLIEKKKKIELLIIDCLL